MIRWRRRPWAVTLSVVFVTGFIAASITPISAAAKSPITLNLFLGQLTSNSQGQMNMLNSMIAKFEKQNAGIKVQYQTYNGASQELTTIETSIATHQGPSIFDVGFLPTAYYTGGFQMMTPSDWAMIGGKQKFFAKQFGEAGPNAKQIIGIPWEVLPFALAYNKEMFQKAGIKSPPTTWTEFVNDAKKMTNPAKNQWGTGIDPADSLDPWHVNWVMTRQMGGNFVNPSKTKGTLNSPPVVNSLSFWFNWVTKFKIASPNNLDWKNQDLTSAFENGHIAMLPMQSMNLVPALEKSAIKNEWAFAPMPTVPYGDSKLPRDGVPVGTFISGDFFAIPKYVTGAQFTAALKWVKFFTGVSQQREMSHVYGYLPSNIAAYKNYAPLDTPLVNSLVRSENNAYPYPFTGVWGNIEVAYGGVANKIADEIATNSYKNGDIQRELQAANQQVQQALQK